MKAVVIGSGLSGLVTAAYLAQAGHEVTVYEQNKKIGGAASETHKDGYSWDNGPLNIEGLYPGELAGTVIDELGIRDSINLIPAERVISFTKFTLHKPENYGGEYWRRDLLKEHFPKDAAGIDEYYKLYDRMILLSTIGKKGEVAHGLEKIWWNLRLLLAFLPIKKMKNWTAKDVLDHYFSDATLKAVFSGILADFVTKPSEFPGLGIPFINLETSYESRLPVKRKNGGVQPRYCYVDGGIEKLSQAIADAVTEAGGKIVTGMAVKQVVLEGETATGVVLADGTNVEADVVVASGGGRESIIKLIGRKKLMPNYVNAIESQQLMESILMVHLGVEMDTHAYQSDPLVYYYLSTDVEGAVDRARKGIFHEGKDGFLVFIPSYFTPKMAPKGCQAVTVYTIAPDKLAKGSWEKDGARLAEKMLDEAEKIIPGLRSHTKTRVDLTPVDFRKMTHLDKHAFGGRAPIIGKNGIPIKTPIEGFYFVGAQGESGGGVGSVIAGGRKAARMIMDMH
ncbi:MAG TPA: NAD(P)/FAD-dependent oxidoreductase [Longilinea sp.]|nr:NAD(P)/FAD-dependent oxidoreductase [Longilinea sp.]